MIVDPIDPIAIRLGNQGPGVITDNVIRSLHGAGAPVISWTSFVDADVVSVGNTFTVASAIRSNGRLVSIDDRVLPPSAINPVEPTLPEALPNLHRQVFEVPAGAGAGAIQDVILAAARQRDRRPIVHFADGIYSIGETLTIPTGDIQLAGDGYGTILRWTGTGTGPVVALKGPSRATLREIQIDGANRADGIIVENANQSGSRTYMDQVQMRSGQRTDLFIDGLDNTYVQMEDIGYAYSPDAVSIRVTGGPLSAAGRVTPGRTSVFSGASSGGRTSYDVSAGARVLVRDLWYESGAGPGFAAIHDRARFTIDGARIASPANQPVPAFDISRLNGQFTILSTHIDDRIVISGDGSRAEVLALGIFAEQKSSSYFVDAAQPAARAILVNARQLSSFAGNRSISTPDVGGTDPSFVRRLLSHTRSERPAVLRALPAGVTDVRMFRVWVTNGINNISLIGARRGPG